MPQERIFTLKEGTEFPKSFAGATVPFTVPTSDAEIKALVPDEATRVAVFNQAHALNVQKSIKVEANKPGATIESLRAHAVGFKYGQVRVRTGNGAGGATKIKPATVEKVLGGDLLASFTPEQRKMYETQLAALRPKVAEATANGAANNAPAEPATTTAGPSKKK